MKISMTRENKKATKMNKKSRWRFILKTFDWQYLFSTSFQLLCVAHNALQTLWKKLFVFFICFVNF
jgi:hypothetical protein